jgi:hypothetical protein
MAAIDLLFDGKRDSERLHKLVLGALLQRTLLLSRLVPLGGTPTQIQLQFEPERKTYDLGLGLTYDDARAGSSTRCTRVFVEIKIDSPLSEDQLAQQLNPARLRAEDRLLYLLLGYSAITTDRALLRERIRRIGEHTSRPDLLDRVSLRESVELIPLLADPVVLPPGRDHRDARDLTAAYRDALLSLAERTQGFAARPVSEWQEGDFYGFFAACRSRGIIGAELGLCRGQIGRVAGSEGSAVGYAFGAVPLPAGLGQLELQFENARLCLRLQTASKRKLLGQRVFAAITAAGLLEAGASPLGPLSPVPLRLSAVMTLAQREGLLDGFPDRFDWSLLQAKLAAAEAALREVADQLQAE